MLQLFINNGSGDVDYSRFVTWSSVQITDALNTPVTCQFLLTNIDQTFVVPSRSAYVKIYSTKNNKYLFTGFISVVPERAFLGVGGNVPAQNFQRLAYTVNAASDEYLLNIKSIQFLPAFVNQTQGQILTALANALAPGFFDVSGIQDGDLVPYFLYDASQKWSDIAKKFGDASRFRYQALNKQLFYAPYGDATLSISYDDTKGQSTFDPLALESNIVSVPVVNDATVIGDVEPQNIHDDVFVGDGITLLFPLKHQLFHGETEQLLQEDWTGTSFSSQLWDVVDPASQFNLVGTLEVDGVSGALGSSYIQAKNGVELGGHLDLQHGEFFFFNTSTGLVGGVHSSSPPTKQNCLLGFEVTPTASVAVNASGASGLQLGVVVSGGNPANFLLFSEQLDNAAWVPGGSLPPTVTPNAVVDPNGHLTAEKVVFPATGVGQTTQLLQDSGIAWKAGDAWAFSIFLRSDTPGSVIGLRILQSGGGGNDILLPLSVGTAWTRFVVSGTLAGTGGTVQCLLWNGASSPGVTIYAWGAQLNRGFGAAPYQQTTGQVVNEFTVITRINHHYFLETLVSARTWARFTPVYRTLAGTPFGGTNLPAQAQVTFIIWDIDQATPWDQTPIKFVTTVPGLPSFGLYVPIDAQLLNLTLTGTLLSQPPQGLLTVQSLYGPTGTSLPILPSGIGPVQPYGLGFGAYGQQVATITKVGDADQLAFYAGSTLPAAGSRIKLTSWEAGAAVARVQDPAKIASEALIVGDDGIRAATFQDLQPLPRTSADCEVAAQATITDRENPQFEGQYGVQDFFWNPRQAPENLFLQSQDFELSPWQLAGGPPPTITPDNQVDPLGGMTADTVTMPSSGSHLRQTVAAPAGVVIAGQTFTVSLYIKVLSGTTSAILTLKDQNGFVLLPSGFLVINGNAAWQRVTLTGTALSNATSIVLDIQWSAAGSWAIWGAQLNPGPVADAYVQTKSKTIVGDYPRSGRYLAVNSPTRGIVNQNLIARSVTTTVIAPFSEKLMFVVQFGQDLFVEKLITRFAPKPQSILTTQDTATPPTPLALSQVGLFYLNDLVDVQVLSITGNQIQLDLGVTPVTGVEIRSADVGWARSPAGLVQVATQRFVTLPRPKFEQLYFLRQVNGGQFSRNSRVIRVVAPTIPTAPIIGAIDISDPLHVQLYINFTGEVRNIDVIEIDDTKAGTVVLQDRYAGQAQYYWVYDNSAKKDRNPLLFARFANLMWEYSSGTLVNIQIPTPACTVFPDDVSSTFVVSVSGIAVNLVELRVFSTLSGAQAQQAGATGAAVVNLVASGAQAVNFAASGANLGQIPFLIRGRDYVQLRYIVARATDPLGTGPWSSVLQHVYVTQPVVEFIDGNELGNVGFPLNPSAPPQYGGNFSGVAPDLTAQAWTDYAREITRRVQTG